MKKYDLRLVVSDSDRDPGTRAELYVEFNGITASQLRAAGGLGLRPARRPDQSSVQPPCKEDKRPQKWVPRVDKKWPKSSEDFIFPEPEIRNGGYIAMKKEFNTEWQGAKGLMKLRCPKCKRSFITFLRKPQKEISCKCGQTISLDHMARFECECLGCKDSRYGRTNIEDNSMSFICANCGTENNLTWSPAIKSYTNIKERMA